MTKDEAKYFIDNNNKNDIIRTMIKYSPLLHVAAILLVTGVVTLASAPLERPLQIHGTSYSF